MKPKQKIMMWLLGAALAPTLLLAGCSRAAMKSAPLWDADYHKANGPAENRVNLWPAFYYRDPAMSILWPLISVTDEGSAFVPFYEHDKPKDELRLGTMHQFLPPAAIFAGKEDYTRVLNCIRDRKDDSFIVLPIYFQNFKEPKLLIIPALYRDKDVFWTPLYMQSNDLTGVLGPLFNVSKNGSTKTYNMPYPLAGVKTGEDTSGFWMLPAVYYGRTGKTSHLNLGGVLLDMQQNEKSWEAMYAALLGGAARKENGDGHNYLLPLWIAWREGEKNGFLSLPYSHTQDRDGSFTAAGFNAWVESKGKDGTYQSVFWPLFHRYENAERAGHMVLPLYAFTRDKDGKVNFRSLPFNYKNNGELINLLGPAYLSRNDKDGRYTTVAFPLAHAWKNSQGEGLTVLPLFWNSQGANGDKMLLTPLGGAAKVGEAQYLNVGGPFYFSKRGKDDSYLTVLWPLAHWWDGKENKGTALLPVYYDKQGKDGARVTITALGGRAHSEQGEVLDLGGPIFFRKKDKDGSYTTAAWPLLHLWEGGGEKGAALLPAFYWTRTAEGGTLVTPLGGGSHSPTDDILNLGGPLFYQHRDTKAGTFYRTLAWPLWHESEDKNSKSKTLLPVFHYSKGNGEGGEYDFVSLPYSTGKGGEEQYVNIGGILYHHATGPRKDSTILLADLIGWEHEKKLDRHELHVFPIFDLEESPERIHRNVLLSGYTASKKDEATLRREMAAEAGKDDRSAYYYSRRRQMKERHALGFLYTSNEELIGHTAALKAGESAGPNETVIENRDGKQRKFTVHKEASSRVFPIAYHKETEGKGAETNVLWRLYDSVVEEKPGGAPSYERQRVLWRVYHREAEGDHVTVDIFPFMTYDRTKEWSRFTFAGGLFGKGRKDGKSYTQLMWVKF